MLDVAAADATKRGEGIGLTVIAWARALLYNGLGIPDQAFAAAQEAVDCPTNSAAAAWGMVELVEAAARVGEPEAAAEAARRFAEIAKAAGTDWALGVDARSCALLSTGETAERLYREALDRLGRCQMRVDLARAHLLYGEWLRREHRRVDARAQLRAAQDQFTSMGMEAFAERARSELAGHGRNGAQADRRDARRPDCAGAADRAAGPRWAVEPGDRCTALPQPPHRRVAPAQGVRQARDPVPPRAVQRVAELRVRTGPCLGIKTSALRARSSLGRATVGPYSTVWSPR